MTVTIILSWTGQDAATVRAAISIKDDLVGPASLTVFVYLCICICVFGCQTLGNIVFIASPCHDGNMGVVEGA